MTLGKLIIVGLTTVIVNAVLQANGATFTMQLLVAVGIGGFLGFVDALSEDKTKDGK